MIAWVRLYDTTLNFGWGYHCMQRREGRLGQGPLEDRNYWLVPARAWWVAVCQGTFGCSLYWLSCPASAGLLPISPECAVGPKSSGQNCSALYLRVQWNFHQHWGVKSSRHSFWQLTWQTSKNALQWNFLFCALFWVFWGFFGCLDTTATDPNFSCQNQASHC